MNQIKGCIITSEMMNRFQSKIRKTPEGCWEWAGSRDKNGYGYFSVNGKTVKAHRFSYASHYGTIPNELLVLHHCDNSGCVNPIHLWLGTPGDNMKDRDQKERGKFHFQKGENHPFKKNPELNTRQYGPRPPEKILRGEKSPHHKVTSSDVINIKRLRNQERLKLREIASVYNISEAQVSRLAGGKSWEHLEADMEAEI